MIDRAEVERIRKNATVATESGMDMWLPPEQIAELCRVYLAYLDAPVGTVDSCDFSGYERPAWIVIDDREAVPLNEPRRVRLVTDAEAK